MFGPQHIQQLQVIQRLQQQQRAALAARTGGQPTTLATNANVPPLPGDAASGAGNLKQQQVATAVQQMTQCTECAECAECAAKQMQEEGEFNWN